MVDIRQAVCWHFHLKEDELLSETRQRCFARPRQIGMYVAKHNTRRSYGEIARAFGKADPTTVRHAVKQIDKLRKSNPEIAYAVSSVYRNAEAIALRRQHEASFRDPFARPQA